MIPIQSEISVLVATLVDKHVLDEEYARIGTRLSKLRHIVKGFIESN
jgi:hypothetical protein